MMGIGMLLMMGLWLIVPLLLMGSVVSGLGWRPQLHSTGSTQTNQTPLEILQARYARGEISSEEYDQIHHDLEG